MEISQCWICGRNHEEMQKDLKDIISSFDDDDYDYIGKPKDINITDKILIPHNCSWG